MVDANFINSQKVWQRPRIRLRGVCIELDERKPVDTACLIVFPIIACIGFGVLPFLSFNQSPIGFAIGLGTGSIAVVMSIVIFVVYRPPRVLKIYPIDGLAYAYYRGLRFKPFARWYDLVAAPFDIEQRAARGEKIESTGQTLIGCLGVVFAPLALLSFMIGPQQYEQIVIYCLTHPSTGSKPIVVLNDRIIVQQIVDFYDDIEQSYSATS